MKKTAVQIDFDGTVTEEDVSFLLLDTYADGNWRKYLDEYSSRKISVGAFNKKAFGMVKADKKTMTDFVLNDPRVKIRPGFKDFINYCKSKRFKIVIVSNGLTFYIKAILNKFDIKGLDIYAAENIFSSDGMKVRYLGPDGKEVDADSKVARTDMLCRKGYRVIYIGNGNSDIYPARKAQYVCATDNLLQRCREENLKCFPFENFYDVVKIIENLKLN